VAAITTEEGRMDRLDMDNAGGDMNVTSEGPPPTAPAPAMTDADEEETELVEEEAAAADPEGYIEDVVCCPR
jgi:hypothetical protein